MFAFIALPQVGHEMNVLCVRLMLSSESSIEQRAVCCRRCFVMDLQAGCAGCGCEAVVCLTPLLG